jgi:hypothetical protein
LQNYHGIGEVSATAAATEVTTTATTATNSLSSSSDGGGEPSEAVLRAKAYAAFESGNFRELYRLIEVREFDQKHHTALQNMWYTARYREAEAVRGRSLGKWKKDRKPIGRTEAAIRRRPRTHLWSPVYIRVEAKL